MNVVEIGDFHLETILQIESPDYLGMIVRWTSMGKSHTLLKV